MPHKFTASCAKMASVSALGSQRCGTDMLCDCRAATAALRTVYKKYTHTTHSKVSLLHPPRSLLEA